MNAMPPAAPVIDRSNANYIATDKTVRECIAEATGRTRDQIDAQFELIDVDALDTIKTAILLEEAFGFEVNELEIASAMTVDGLVVAMMIRDAEV